METVGTHISRIANKVERVKTNSALNPLLWISATVTPSFLAACVFAPNTFLQYAFGCISLVPLLATVIAYAHFAIKDPDRLHSEDFQLRRSAIEIMSKDGTVISDPNSIVNVTNPEDKALDKDDE